MFGRSPLKIDILTSITGIKFSEAFKNKFVCDIGLVKNVYFNSLDDLLKNKNATVRQKDKYDLQWIKTYGKDS